MRELFITVLNMSVTASYVALAVMLARLPLKRAPKAYSYALWAVVLFRLVCPISFESLFSVTPAISDTITQGIVSSQSPAINSGIAAVDNAVNQTIQGAAPAAVAGGNIMELLITIAAYVWLLGIAAVLCYAAVSYIRLRRSLSAATQIRGNIFETDYTKTPFVMGFMHPKIYLPSGLAESETGYIIEHEQTHIRRKDHIIKPLAFLALAVHWFNPLVWLSYFLMAKDMELSCDESVMKRSGEDIRVKYSGSLLSLSVKQSGLPCPLAFGESNVKSRVKNVLNYKKRGFWITIIAIIAVIALVLGLATNRPPSYSFSEMLEENRFFTTEETDPLKIGEAAFNHYFSLFIGKDVPDEERITEFNLHEIKLIAGDEREFCVYVYFDMASDSTAGVNWKPEDDGTVSWPDEQREIRVKALGDKQYEIVGVGTGGYTQGLEPVVQGGYVYTSEALGFSIAFPAEWEDELLIKEYVDNDMPSVVYFVHKATYDTADPEHLFGTLFRIYVYNPKEKWEEYNHTEFTGERIIAESGAAYYSLEYPTDVQVAINDETLMAGYMEISETATRDWLSQRITVLDDAA